MHVTLGVSGGIAAYKVVQLSRQLLDEGIHVAVVMSEAAQQFVGKATFSALSSEPVKTSLFTDSDPIAHTRLGRGTDLMVVAPATADVIAKFANGLADDLLSATYLATKAPVLIAPAMHEEMWENPATRRNIAFLQESGVYIIAPSWGRLAGGDVGVGRMADPGHILSFALSLLCPDRISLKNRRVLVTAGGTKESLDPIRYLGNRSSGKQGFAFARTAAAWGAEVSLVSSVDGGEFPGIECVRVESAAEMRSAVLERFEASDICVMAAAVADFAPKEFSTSKIKKGVKSEELLELCPTVDIAAELGRIKTPRQILVSFAAETDHLEKNIREKLISKNADIVVGNDVTQPGAGFGGDLNCVTIIDSTGETRNLDGVKKTRVAEVTLRWAMELADRELHPK